MFCPISPWAQRLLSRSTLTVDAAPQQHARHHHSAQPVQAHERELPGAAPGTTRKGRTSPSPTLYQHWILYQNTWAGLPKSWSGNRTPRQQVGMAHLFPNVRFQAPRSGMRQHLTVNNSESVQQNPSMSSVQQGSVNFGPCDGGEPIHPGSELCACSQFRRPRLRHHLRSAVGGPVRYSGYNFYT